MTRKLLFLFLIILSACTDKPSSDVKSIDRVQSLYVQDADTLQNAVKKLQTAYNDRHAEQEIQQLFFDARLAYKHVEYLAEYYNPATARAINGAALEKVEEEDPNKTVMPEGFQVLEEMLLPHIDTSKQADIRQQLAVLVSNVSRLRKVADGLELTDGHVFDAVRLQILRVITLGLTGFDTPITLRSMSEAAVSLEALENVIKVYPENASQHEAIARWKHAVQYLREAKNFDEFDRAEFIISSITPLITSLQVYQQSLAIPPRQDGRAFAANAANLFANEAWNVDYFAPNYARPLTNAKSALGKLLFYDPILSENTDRACASCHQPERAFTDGLPTSRMLNGTSGKLRNAPTLIFAGMQNAQFYDMHVTYLEDQATGVILNPIEMHGSLNRVVAQLQQSEEYKQLFRQAFPEAGDSVITSAHIRIALAAFIRSLQPMNAPFDRFIRGDRNAINAEAKHGFRLFTGKAKCATCHFMPFFNGTVPPNFTETEAEILGVPYAPDTIGATIDADLGKFTFSQAPIEKHAFKTPTLRNIALTAPYMHNGVYTMLEEVIDFYNRGGGNGIGISLDNQTLPTDKLNLRADEKQALIAFLRTLTDTTGITSRPRQLPMIPGRMKNVRKVGGIY